MDKRILYPSDTDGVCIITPAANCPLTIDEIAAKDVPAGKPFRIVDAASIPQDITFIDAWSYSNNCTVDIAKAKAIVHAKRRAVRAAEFAPLDIEATIPAKAAQAEAARQVVRVKYEEIQKRIDAASTPEELKQIVVAVIGVLEQLAPGLLQSVIPLSGVRP